MTSGWQPSYENLKTWCEEILLAPDANINVTTDQEAVRLDWRVRHALRHELGKPCSLDHSKESWFIPSRWIDEDEN